MKADQDVFNQELADDGIADSRFNMWRAVVAMAHADGLVVDEERHMIDRWLENVPFSDAQKKQLRADLLQPQDPAALLAAVGEAEDCGLFFEFARALVWSDGDNSAQEEKIMDRLQKWEMDKIHAGSLEMAMRADHEKSVAGRLREDAALRKEAHQKLGFGRILHSLMTGNVPFKAVAREIEDK